MAPKPPQKQSLLKKALLQNRTLTQEVLMYQRLMQVLRLENGFEDIPKFLPNSAIKASWRNHVGSPVGLALWNAEPGGLS